MKTQALQQIEFGRDFQFNVFICHDGQEDLDGNTKAWIEKFQDAPNKNESKTIQEACSTHRPYWYSLSPKPCNIITSINPYERIFFTFSKEQFFIDQRLIAMQTKKGYDVELIAALLNSVITYLYLEMLGIPRNLGALDLNANFPKQLYAPDPNLLSAQQKEEIIKAFAPLKRKHIGSVMEEIKDKDRVAFDQKIFECYKLDPKLLDATYELLSTTVCERISMRDK